MLLPPPHLFGDGLVGFRVCPEGHLRFRGVPQVPQRHADALPVLRRPVHLCVLDVLAGGIGAGPAEAER